MEIVIKFKNWILEFSLLLSLSLTLTSALCIHPLTLCLTLVTLAARIGVLSGLIFIRWIFYAVILIFLGGIIVVFIYVTTLAGNEKFRINFVSPLLGLLIFCTSFIYFYFPTLTQIKKEIFMGHVYFSRTTPVLWFLIMFLLSTLIVVIKLAENFKGTLTKFL